MEFQRNIKNDFEFYKQFIESARTFQKKEDNLLSEAWVQILTKEKYDSTVNQYNRNIFLANLVVCIQKKKLTGPFTKFPADCGLPKATEIFGTTSTEIKDPKWLDSIVNNDIYCNVRAKDKRTYLATKAMPDGSGALGYIAVSLADDEPQWIQKEGGFYENRDFKKGIENEKEEVPTVDEKKLQRYKSLLNEIQKEMSGTEAKLQNTVRSGT